MKTPELPDLVSMEFTSDKYSGARVEAFRSSKELVFRKDADLLNPRQQKIVILAIEGKTNRQIASISNISHHTVRNHLVSAADKIEAKLKSLNTEPASIPEIRDRIWIITSLLRLGELELQ